MSDFDPTSPINANNARKLYDEHAQKPPRLLHFFTHWVLNNSRTPIAAEEPEAPPAASDPAPAKPAKKGTRKAASIAPKPSE